MVELAAERLEALDFRFELPFWSFSLRILDWV
jgi:hypothetical protein